MSARGGHLTGGSGRDQLVCSALDGFRDGKYYTWTHRTQVEDFARGQDKIYISFWLDAKKYGHHTSNSRQTFRILDNNHDASMDSRDAGVQIGPNWISIDFNEAVSSLNWDFTIDNGITIVGVNYLTLADFVL